jgi:hypothetical protein
MPRIGAVGDTRLARARAASRGCGNDAAGPGPRWPARRSASFRSSDTNAKKSATIPPSPSRSFVWFLAWRYNPAVRGFSAFAVVALLLVIAPTAGGTGSGAVVRVTITRASCGVLPRTIEAGSAVFRIANRSGRRATFAVGGRRASVRSGRTARVVVSLRAGRVAYSCRVDRRRVRGGFLRVTPRPPPLTEHRIGVREVSGVGEFYDRTTGARLVPRGSNYIRVAPQVDVFGRTQVYHSTFNLGDYDAARADAALSRMAVAGYNVVRVFVNNTCVQRCSANMRTGQISSSYVANVADFLRRARAHGVFVILTGDWLPSGALYDAIAADLRRDWFDDVNLVFLSPQGVEMSIRFWRDFIRELIRQHAALDAIFAYSLWNEASVDFRHLPFTLPTGRITTANGQTYDMASSADTKRMIDDAFVYYSDQVRTAILQVDPSALVTIGFWTAPDSPAGALVMRSRVDFVDIHPYPGFGATFAESMQMYGIEGPTAKPVVIGEMGATRVAFGTVDDAAADLVAWQRQSCAYGIDGWLLWTWDTDEQPELWNALSGAGVIEQALAPKNRPDPCT